MNALVINSSGRTQQSVSRQLVAELVAELTSKHPGLQVTHRDVATALPFVNDLMISGAFLPAEHRTPEQVQSLAFSDLLVQELKAADVLVIGAPMYNFGIPASLKTWVDLVARSGLTFRYTEAGPVGLLEGKKAYLVIATGGVPVGSPYDLATPHLRQVLALLGITDVEVISADQSLANGERPIGAAQEAIRQIGRAA